MAEQNADGRTLCTGLIASGNDQETIENLVTSYIQKSSCIILLTIAGESEEYRCFYERITLTRHSRLG